MVNRADFTAQRLLATACYLRFMHVRSVGLQPLLRHQDFTVTIDDENAVHVFVRRVNSVAVVTHATHQHCGYSAI